MSFASKYSKGSRFNYQFPDKPNYTNLSEWTKFVGDSAAVIRRLSINERSQFGPQPCAWLDGDICLNLPKYATEQVRTMIADQEVVDAVNSGAAGIKARKYTGKDGKEYIGFEWVDMPVE